MWLDEALTVNIARLPLGDLRGALERDGAPPLYYVLLHIWTGVFGDSDVAARSLSGGFALGAVITCWFAARRWFDERTAWLTVIVLATNPFLIRYATEARMYTLEILLARGPHRGAACAGADDARPLGVRQPRDRRARVHAVLGVLPRRDRRGNDAARRVAARGAAPRIPHGRRRDRSGAAAVRSLAADVPVAARAHRYAVGRRGAPRAPDRDDVPRFAGGDEQEGWVLVFLLVAAVARPVRAPRRPPPRSRPACSRRAGSASSVARRSWSA